MFFAATLSNRGFEQLFYIKVFKESDFPVPLYLQWKYHFVVIDNKSSTLMLLLLVAMNLNFMYVK